ncbi:putative membrane protein YhiD involved in acid resistance [Dysgonomonadaceae bacterium PH5-43]|nr:putative membrane protein YhiD involved in acid resistance [Dysgonomonadaceae bacterium PH5-43]
MSNISIDSILQASNAIIINPSKSLKDFGIDVFLLHTSPALFLGKKIFDLIQRKKKESEEKERMYQEIVARQQAAINKQKEINRKLEILIRESDVRNERNQREIIRMREQIKNLEEVIELLGKTSQQVT